MSTMTSASSANQHDCTQDRVTLSILIGTYNRLDLLKQCIDSIIKETKSSFRIYVTDAGSTDGTVEYLKRKAAEDSRVVPVLMGKKLGQARSLNMLLGVLNSDYACWLSDDNEIVNNGLDTAVEILRGRPNIGMVALKVRDVVGPFTKADYIGGCSSVGILNANQGMLPTELFRSLGGFDEEFRDYGIDPDLTARVIFSGFDVVYTRRVAILHHREWMACPDQAEVTRRHHRQLKARAAYHERYAHSGGSVSRVRYRLKLFVYQAWHHRFWLDQLYYRSRRLVGRILRKLKILPEKKVVPAEAKTPAAPEWQPPSNPVITEKNPETRTILGYSRRDWKNVFCSRYISIFDFLLCRGQEYYLRQRGDYDPSVDHCLRNQERISWSLVDETVRPEERAA